eukprot:9038432-Karenia_brevis.AAC.1
MGSGGSPLAFQFFVIVACAISTALPFSAAFGTGPMGCKDGNMVVDGVLLLVEKGSFLCLFALWDGDLL